MKYTCPCCGYKTLSSPSPGSFENCPVCDWEDDGYQFENPYLAGGANRLSLWQAQQKFLTPKILPQYPGSSVRPPRDDEPKDSAWRPVPSPANDTDQTTQ